jgi:hypothetical protein
MGNLHLILQQNNVCIGDRDKICYNYGIDIRIAIMRAIKTKVYSREAMLNQLNMMVKEVVYPEIAKFDKSQPPKA